MALPAEAADPASVPFNLDAEGALDAFMDDEAGVADHAKRRFTIDDDGAAEWAGRLRAKVKAELEDLDDRYGSMLDDLAKWYNRRAGPLHNRLGWIDPMLEDYAIRRREATGKATLDLPSVVVRTTKGTKPRIEIVDRDAVLVWARSMWPDAVKIEEELLVGEAKKGVSVTTNADGDLVCVDSAGQVVAGMEATAPTTTAKVAE